MYDCQYILVLVYSLDAVVSPRDWISLFCQALVARKRASDGLLKLFQVFNLTWLVGRLAVENIKW